MKPSKFKLKVISNAEFEEGNLNIKYTWRSSFLICKANQYCQFTFATKKMKNNQPSCNPAHRVNPVEIKPPNHVKDFTHYT